MTSGPPFHCAAAAGDTADAAVAAVLAGLGAETSGGTLGGGRSTVLGLVYVTERFAPALPRIVEALRTATGVAHWTGCAGAGICGRDDQGRGVEIHGGGAISVMLADLPADSFRVLDTLLQPEDMPGYRDDMLLDDWDGAEAPLLGIIHADPRNTAVPEMIGLLPEALEGYLVGGLTITPGTPGVQAQVAGGITGGGISGALVSAAVPVAVGLSQGCRPLGPPRQITAMDGDWVAALDGRPAVESLKDDLGPDAFAQLRDLGGVVHAALPVEGSDTKDYVVRNLVAVDLNSGRVGVSADLDEGDRLMFVRRDAESAEDDLRRMIRRLTFRARTPPRGALYISCLARGPHMFPPDRPELSIVAEELGDVPLTGFFANGEINNNRLYAYTGVLTLFL